MTSLDPETREYFRSEPDCGSALVMVLGFAMIIGTLLMGAVTTTVLQARTIRHGFDKTYAMGIAEGVVELAHKTIVDEVSDFRSPPNSGTATLDGNSVLWTATEIDGLVERTDEDGVRMLCQPYQIDVRFDSGEATARITRIVDLTLCPIYQYSLFQNFLFELSPAHPLTIEGRIQVNSDLYLDTETELRLETSALKTTGGVFRGRIEGDPGDGDVEILAMGAEEAVELTEENDSSNPGWAQTALREWQGTVESGAHGTDRVGSPTRAAIEAGGYYETQAGLKVIGLRCYDSSGAMVTLPGETIWQESIFDAHQQKYVQVTNIDLAALARSGIYPTNGLIYASRPEATESQPNGIRLVNGAQLPTPLTVVTANPIYIQGDYNTIDKKPASVIADAVNLLSNGWRDSDPRTRPPGTLPQGSKPSVLDDKVIPGLQGREIPGLKDRDKSRKDELRPAESTTFNLSITAGVALDGGVIAGGFENFVRLHEDWADETLTFLGSMVILFESELATKPVSASAYAAPIPSFSFDSDLLSATFLPPYTPNAVSLRRIFWDDNNRIEFKVSDSKLSLFPDAPVYDPWNYDGTFMTGVIEDPNEYLLEERQVDYSDVNEAEAPITQTREIVTDAEGRKVLKDRVKDHEKAAKKAEKRAKEAEKDSDLAAAQAALADAEAELAAAADAYAQTGHHKSLRKHYEKVEKATEKARKSVEKIEKKLAEDAAP